MPFGARFPREHIHVHDDDAGSYVGIVLQYASIPHLTVQCAGCLVVVILYTVYLLYVDTYNIKSPTVVVGSSI